jgi:hypothetical protein
MEEIKSELMMEIVTKNLKLNNIIKEQQDKIIELENKVNTIIELENKLNTIIELENKLNTIIELENKVNTIIELENKVNTVLEKIDKVNNEPILICVSDVGTHIYMNKSIETLDLTPYKNHEVCWYNFPKFNNIKELVVNTDGHQTGICRYFKYPDIKPGYFHQITTLKIVCTTTLDELGTREHSIKFNYNVNRIINLEELIFENFNFSYNGITRVCVGFIKLLKKLTKLVFINCSDESKLFCEHEQLSKYCESNNIQLISK